MMNGEVRPWHYALGALLIALLVMGWVKISQRGTLPRAGVTAGAAPATGPAEDATPPPGIPTQGRSK
jgi:hypothetical protein